MCVRVCVCVFMFVLERECMYVSVRESIRECVCCVSVSVNAM